MYAMTKRTTTDVTVDAEGKLVLPAKALRALRSADERLTLLDVEISVENGTLVLRRSTIDEDDWWAYTPEMMERLDRASRQAGFRVSKAELERLIDADDPQSAVQELIRLKQHAPRT